MRSIAGWQKDWRIAVSLLVFVVVGITESRAQPKAGEKEWGAVVEAAKKEGKVVVAGSPDPVMRTDVIPKFTARFGVAVEFIAVESDRFARRDRAGIGHL